MGVTEAIALGALILSIFGAIGATIRWAAIQFKDQGGRLDNLKSSYSELHREHTLVLVKLERFRLAFQMVASELARKSPGNVALVHAKALLAEAFTVDPDIPEDMKEKLETIQ